MVFRRSIGVAFHSTERFCAGFFSAGTGVETGSGNAEVFVSAVASEVTASVEGFAAGVVELLTGAATINGDGGIMMEVASAGPATSGICFNGFSGIGIGGVVVGAAGVTGVVSGIGGLDSGVGIGAGVTGVVGAGAEGTGVAGFPDGVPTGVVVAGVPV
jgi:hypothetical protein